MKRKRKKKIGQRGHHILTCYGCLAVYFILVCFQPASQTPQNLYSIFGCFLKIVTSSSFSTYTKKKKCLFFSHIFYQKTHTRINFHFRFILAEYLMNTIQLIVWCFGETHKKSPVIDSHFQTSLETDEDDDEENLFSLTFVQICHKQNNKNKLNIKQWHKGWFDAFLIYFSWEFSFLFSGFFVSLFFAFRYIEHSQTKIAIGKTIDCFFSFDSIDCRSNFVCCLSIRIE